MKKIVSLILVLSFVLSLVSCQWFDNITDKSTINGVNLSKYSIVYSEDDYDYAKRAAEYIQSKIIERTSLVLPLVEDSEEPATEYEIVVGNTNRDISKTLDADTKGLEFAILAEEKQIALEADYFIIAAAAYFFIETYVPTSGYDAIVPQVLSIHTPIVKEANN